MRNGWRPLLAALATIGLSTGLASAQGIPQPMPSTLPASAIQQATPKQADTKVQQTNGCLGGGCGAAAPAPVASAPLVSAAPTPSLAHRFLSPLTIGPGCANTIGQACWAADRTVFFGGSKQFFNPGNKCGPRCGAAYGPGNLGNYNNCGYFSYLDR